MTRDPYRYYRIEARELLEGLRQGALELERGAGPPAVARLLRLAHTLKGASRVVKQGEIAALAHELEGELEPYRDGGTVATASSRDIVRLLADVDGLLKRIEGPPVAGQSGEARREPVQAIRIDVDQADAVLRVIDEQGAHRAALLAQVARVEQAWRLAGVLADQLAPRRNGADGVASAKALPLAEDLRAALARIRRELAVSAEQAARDEGELREAAERLRLASTGALFTPLEQAVRDAAVALGTRVTFAATGGENRLDVAVLSPLRQALLHIVRNAVAHGIEPSATRVAAGKPEEGRVELRVERRGHLLVFTCRDDGRGVDLEGVRRAAVARGIVTETAARSLDAEQSLGLLLRGGITTTRSLTEVSGRGVGLDVVREIADELRASVSLRTEPGVGTSVELSVPVTLSSATLLFVAAGNMAAAIPLEAVSRTFRVAAGAIGRSGRSEVVLDGDEALPFVRLARVLGHAGSARAPATACSAVVVGDAGGRVAIGVDRLLGVESSLVRPVPAMAPSSALVAGISLDSTGNPNLVLDPAGLAAAVRAAVGEPAAAPASARLPVLVVDDSLTTRMLEQSILESAGYEVDLATSAEEGLERAGARRYGLFLVDVEMPGMDGFAFVERTRSDPALRDVPSILVTSRDSGDDRRRGVEVGARAYMVKSEFDQERLLRTIGEILG
jgi:two-component system chemotaxis sensor kinase CheA